MFCQLKLLPKMSITFQKHNALKVQTASGVKWDMFYILVPLTYENRMRMYDEVVNQVEFTPSSPIFLCSLDKPITENRGVRIT